MIQFGRWLLPAGILGLMAVLFGPVPALAAWWQWGWFDLSMMIVITFVLLLFAKTHRHSITRWEGVWLLVLYGGYMTFGVVREL